MATTKSTASTVQRLISFVLPVCNEEESLRDLYRQVSDVMKQQPDDYEMIFIDDGSTDGSFDVLREVYQNDRKVRAIQFRRNFGKSAAYNAGFQNAKGEIIITMDTDLQDDPDDIPLFLEKIDEGYDLVVGWRYNRSDPLNKIVPSKIFNKIVHIVTRIPLHDFNCPFKAYRREIIEEIEVYGELHRYIPVLARSKGFSLTEIKIKNLPRHHGKSKYGIERYPRGMLDMLTAIFITRFATRPMHLLGLSGIIVCAIGLGILSFFTIAHVMYILGILADVQWRIHERPFLSLGILLMIVGTQFFSIGLLGELFITKSSSKVGNHGYSIKQILGD